MRKGRGVQENNSWRSAFRCVHMPGTVHSQGSIPCFECILKNQFPALNTVNTFAAEDKLSHNCELNTNGIQIIHCRSNHWIVASTIDCEQVEVCDSLYESIDKKVLM